MNTKNSNARAELEQEVSQAIGRSRSGRAAVGYRLIGSGKAVVSEGIHCIDNDDPVAAELARKTICDHLDRLVWPN